MTRIPLPPGRAWQSAERLLLRGLAVVGLAGVALIHLVQLPDTFPPTPALGWMYVLLIVASTACAAALVVTEHPLLWLLAALAAAAPILGYVFTRAFALPFDDQDVGNWLEPLALVSLFVEAAVIAVATTALFPAAGGRPTTALLPAAGDQPAGARPLERATTPGQS